MILDSYEDTPVCDSEGELRHPAKFNALALERWRSMPEKFSFQRVELASLGRYRNEREPEKVESLRTAMRNRQPIPPIYLKTDTPFINNGNHRVAAARAEGYVYIWAVVEDRGPLKPEMSLPASIR